MAWLASKWHRLNERHRLIERLRLGCRRQRLVERLRLASRRHRLSERHWLGCWRHRLINWLDKWVRLYSWE
jgi:hypothetical protein